MTKIAPATNENSSSGKHLVTRRRLLKQAGAAGIALTAMYVAPSFSSFGPKKAYATITGVPPCDSDLCAPDKRKPAKLTMEYTGLADAGSNTQDADKVEVFGDPGGTSPVYIEANDKDLAHQGDANKKIWFTGQVAVSGNFMIDSASVGDTKLKNKTFVYIYADVGHNTLLQRIEFHTSCSQPLFLGDGFGTLLLKQLVDKFGVIDCDPCETALNICACGKPKVLTMRYTGAAATSHLQDPMKVTITDSNGGPGTTDPVFIKVFNKNEDTVYFSGSRALGATFDIDGGSSTLDSESRIYIFTDSTMTTQLQFARFHTSCSQPLFVDDQFGASRVVGLTT